MELVDMNSPLRELRLRTVCDFIFDPPEKATEAADVGSPDFPQLVNS